MKTKLTDIPQLLFENNIGPDRQTVSRRIQDAKLVAQPTGTRSNGGTEFSYHPKIQSLINAFSSPHFDTHQHLSEITDNFSRPLSNDHHALIEIAMEHALSVPEEHAHRLLDYVERFPKTSRWGQTLPSASAVRMASALARRQDLSDSVRRRILASQHLDHPKVQDRITNHSIYTPEWAMRSWPVGSLEDLSPAYNLLTNNDNLNPEHLELAMQNSIPEVSSLAKTAHKRATGIVGTAKRLFGRIMSEENSDRWLQNVSSTYTHMINEQNQEHHELSMLIEDLITEEPRLTEDQVYSLICEYKTASQMYMDTIARGEGQDAAVAAARQRQDRINKIRRMVGAEAAPLDPETEQKSTQRSVVSRIIQGLKSSFVDPFTARSRSLARIQPFEKATGQDIEGLLAQLAKPKEQRHETIRNLSDDQLKQSAMYAVRRQRARRLLNNFTDMSDDLYWTTGGSMEATKGRKTSFKTDYERKTGISDMSTMRQIERELGKGNMSIQKSVELPNIGTVSVTMPHSTQTAATEIGAERKRNAELQKRRQAEVAAAAKYQTGIEKIGDPVGDMAKQLAIQAMAPAPKAPEPKSKPKSKSKKNKKKPIKENVEHTIIRIMEKR
jgi:hypothetical protein